MSPHMLMMYWCAQSPCKITATTYNKVFQKLQASIHTSWNKPDEQKIKAIQDWPTPTTTKEIRRFIGLTSYYPSFADVSVPLNSLTQKKTCHSIGAMHVMLSFAN